MRMIYREKYQTIMEHIATEHGIYLDFDSEVDEWAYDHADEILHTPHMWWYPTETDHIWREKVLAQYYPDTALQNVPTWVFNFYHEIGHHETTCEYPAVALRKILKGLAEINLEIALAGYFELPEEVEASEWAIYKVMELLQHNPWWEEKK